MPRALWALSRIRNVRQQRARHLHAGNLAAVIVKGNQQVAGEGVSLVLAALLGFVSAIHLNRQAPIRAVGRANPFGQVMPMQHVVAELTRQAEPFTPRIVPLFAVDDLPAPAA